jgi:hypothetical protein
MSNMDSVNKIYTAFGAGNIPALLELFDSMGRSREFSVGGSQPILWLEPSG